MISWQFLSKNLGMVYANGPGQPPLDRWPVPRYRQQDRECFVRLVARKPCGGGKVRGAKLSGFARAITDTTAEERNVAFSAGTRLMHPTREDIRSNR